MGIQYRNRHGRRSVEGRDELHGFSGFGTGSINCEIFV